MTTKQTCILMGLLFAPVVACKGPELEPAASAVQPRGMDDAVMGTENGVRVIAVANEWPGEANIENEVTPLRIRVENQSDQPLQIRYSSFEITAPDGITYNPIPPREASGTVGYESVEPTFHYNSFHIAPYFGPYYSGIPPYAGTFYYDEAYYNEYYPYWTTLPTPEMVARALPEGVIDPGGEVDGYLYFERILQKEGTTITLRTNLMTGDGSDTPFVSLQMPFVMD